LAGLAIVPAHAQDTSALDKQLKAISAQLKAQEARLAAQERLLKTQQDAIAKQSAVIDSQRNQLAKLRNPAQPVPVSVPMPSPRPAIGETPVMQQAVFAMPTTQFAQANSGETRRTNAPAGPVGEAPQKDETPPQVIQSLPEGLAVLTPRNRFVLTPSVEYTATTNDRLVFRGVVIVPGINLGEVDASTDDRNILSTVLDLRYGLTSRLELEARVPYVWSDDRATVLSQGPNGSATQSLYLQDSGIGDIELGARYQINNGLEDWPIFVGNARVKLDTGMGPFDIKRDAAGIAQEVALGSGFMGFSGGFSVLKVTDPAVLFGSVNYVYNLPKDINQTIGNVFVGEVDPSNTINANLGFGFAINPDFSFSLGYSHSYVMPQTTMLGTTRQETTSLQVGALTMGMAYRLGNNTSLNGNFEFGVTAAAPDMRAVFSLPTSF
jgi:uncharacterized coiled-coil protein SlyX